MTSDQQFLRLFARLIIKELVKAAIRKVIELIMEKNYVPEQQIGVDASLAKNLRERGCKSHEVFSRDFEEGYWSSERGGWFHYPNGSSAKGTLQKAEKLYTAKPLDDLMTAKDMLLALPRLNRKVADAIHDQVCSKVPIDSRGLHLPDAQSVRDGAIGKVGDTEMRVGGLPDPRIGVVPSLPSVNPFKPTASVKGREVVPKADDMSPAAVRKRLADFQGVPLHEIVAFKDVKIDGTDVTDFCFCCGDDDGHELGSPGACVSNKTRMGTDIHVGDIVQSYDNGQSSGGDGKVVESIIGNGHKVKWNLSGKENWWSAHELEVLSRGEDVVTRGGERLFASFKETGFNVPSKSTSASSCSCANPACTWRGSFECKYDTFSHLEERGAIE